MPHARLQLVLRFRGPKLDPDAITRALGAEPARTFRVGEAHGASNDLAGWEWRSDTAADAEPLFDAMLRSFASHAAELRACLGTDTTTSLTVVGEVGGIVVASAGQAEERRIDWGSGEFRPFLDSDRVAIYLTPEVVAFLAAIDASIDTHIDFELSDDRPNWWERA